MNFEIIKYSLWATIVLLIGGGLGSFFNMRVKTISLVQHFTAGVVFAAVATELLPKILEVHSILHITIGFSLGVACMVYIKTKTNQMEKSEELKAFPWGILVAIGIDLFIDGILIAIAFLSGKETGQIMTFALVLEVLFLALSLSNELTQKGVQLAVKGRLLLLFSLLLPLGTGSGILILNYLPPTFFTEALSFGAAALLYLVTEELLIEAHETQDTPLITSSFFLGFLIIFVLKD